MTKQWWMGALAALAAIFGAAPTAKAEVVDSVLAVVDKEVILQSEILQQIDPLLEQAKAENPNPEAFEREAGALARQALQEAIDDKLLLREALLAGMAVTDEMVEDRLEDVRKMYPSQEEFLKEISAAGETMGDLRERVRKQVLARSMANTKRLEFEKQIVVSESEIAQYYADHKDEFNRPERVRLRQIFLPAGSDSAERQTARARLEEVKTELDNGTDFAELAKVHSQAPGAEDGGLVGWQSRGDLVEPLDTTAFSIEVGSTSEVLESPGGFHIIKVESKEEAGLAALDEVRTEIEPLIRREAAAEKFDKWIEELRKRGRVQVFI